MRVSVGSSSVSECNGHRAARVGRAGGMQCEVVVRRATPRDWAARAALLRSGLASHHFDAFMFFFFQELTLQACVLCGAVLFIFCGASLRACALLPPAAAAAVAAAVAVAHLALADRHAQRLRGESAGWVAEYRGPPRADGPPPGARVRAAPGDRADGDPAPGPSLLVGTVSVSECWGPRDSGWLHLLAVEARWRRRGVGRALVGASRAHAAAAGLQSLEAAASGVQLAARALLLAAGWEMRGAYHRPVLGAALTLPVVRLGLDLPYA